MNIDRFARWYRWVEYAAFGHALERGRFAFLDRLAHARRILVVGEGDGRSLARLLALAPQARIDVVELSAEMIRLARRRVENSDRVRFSQEHALTASWPKNHYDAVLTFFFLDCFEAADAQHLIGKLAEALSPGAQWLIAEFAIPERGWRRRHARLWIWLMYKFFGAVSGLNVRTLPPIEKLLTAAGLRRLELQKERWGLIQTELWSKS